MTSRDRTIAGGSRLRSRVSGWTARVTEVVQETGVVEPIIQKRIVDLIARATPEVVRPSIGDVHKKILRESTAVNSRQGEPSPYTKERIVVRRMRLV